MSLVIRYREGLMHTPWDNKAPLVGGKTQFINDCIESDISSCGTYVMGVGNNGKFAIFTYDGSVLIEDNFKEIANCYFSKTNAFAVVTHGASKETKVTIFRLANKDRIDLPIGYTKSGKRYVTFSAKDKYMLVQTAGNKVDIFDNTTTFVLHGSMDIIPSITLVGLESTTEPLFYAINTDTIKDGEKGSLFQIYSILKKDVFYTRFFHGAQQIDVYPNPHTSQLLMKTHKYQDDTGLSYYGKNALDLIDFMENKRKRVTVYYGPIYTVSWNHRGDTFAVCAGFMPAHTALYTSKGDPFQLISKDHKNTASFSPSGDLLAVCGFGNLNGEIQLWSLLNMSMIGKCQHGDAGEMEWAPDGRKFLTKVEYRFLREGNQYRVYDYHGKLLNKVDLKETELHSVRWYPKGNCALTKEPPPTGPLAPARRKIRR
jgi:uncharacterized protein with WD repeat